ncbi:hypothetical protein [Candidatus Nesciobacter abundans]|nr:hypothetical protein [Candidatus Nesciobacter abundans]
MEFIYRFINTQSEQEVQKRKLRLKVVSQKREIVTVTKILK